MTPTLRTAPQPNERIELASTTASIQSHRVFVAGAPIEPYRSNNWPLAAMGSTPGSQPGSLNFAQVPARFRDSLKHVMWLFINSPTPASWMNRDGNSSPEWPGSGSLLVYFGYLKGILRLVDQLETDPQLPIRRLTDLDGAHLEELKLAIEANDEWAVKTQNNIKTMLVRIPHWNQQLPDQHQWSDPGWTADEYLTAVSRAGGNRRDRINPSTMSPLLEWCLTLVAAWCDIFAALKVADEVERAAHRSGDSPEKAERALKDMLDGDGVPARQTETGRVIPDWMQVAHTYDVNVTALYKVVNKFGRENIRYNTALNATDLPVETTTKLHNQLWVPGIRRHLLTANHGDGNARPLLSHLRTAAMIVIGYFTGMRGQEVLTLQPGCCPEPLPSESGSGHRINIINGHIFKGLNTGDVPRSLENATPATWATISDARKAVAVVERINEIIAPDSEWLFSDKTGNAPMSAGTVQKCMKSLVAFINTELAPRRSASEAFSVPADDKPLSLDRLRRTIAWFLRNQPEGDVTLALQYHHVDTAMGEGYYSLQENGFVEIYTDEAEEQRLGVIVQERQALYEGAGLSGHAAERAMSGLKRVPEVIRTEKAVRDLKKDPGLIIRETPLGLCLDDPHRPGQRLCQTLMKASLIDEPSTVDCQGDACLNYCCTDDHAEGMRRRAQQLRGADQNPELEPLSDWLAIEADDLDARADKHERNRIVLDVVDITETRTENGTDITNDEARSARK